MQDMEHFKLLDGLNMIHAKLTRAGLPLPLPEAGIPMKQWMYGVLEQSISDQFDLVLSPHKKPTRENQKDDGSSFALIIP